MTRKEQIRNANSMRLSPSEYEEWNKGETIYNHRVSYSEGFEEGAEWVDANPNWHKYPDEKPEKKEGSEWSEVVLVICRGMDLPIKAEFHPAAKDEFGVLSVEYWYSKELAHHIDKEDVLAWMEFPKPPKFD